MLKIIQDNETLNEEIVKKAQTIEDLKREQQKLKTENEAKLQELNNIRQSLSLSEQNHEELEIRNTALREKFLGLDENIKMKADAVNNDMKKFFKHLGLKVTMEMSEESERLVDLKIHFSEKLDHHVTLHYDSITEDYDREYILMQKRFAKNTLLIINVVFQ